MFQLINCPQSPSADQHSTSVELTQKLIYRGMTYDISQYSRPSRTPAEIAQIVGKRLMYRGTTYEIVSAPVSTKLQPQPTHRLCYRGVTYMSNSKRPNHSGIEYAVV